VNTLAAGLFLALSTASPTFPATGSGHVEKTDGEYASVAWALDGMRVSDRGGGGAGVPFRCVATCVVDFGQAVTRWPYANVGSFIVIPVLQFSGPVVSATAVNRCPDCAPPWTWTTQWPTVPITMSGTVLFIDLANNSHRTIFEIAGSGTATAYSYYESMQGPWNYATVRWDFTYRVVPEPSTWLLLGTGLVMVVAVGALRARAPRREPD
jgi:hypothetical protein